jgi:hypothetical protein
VLGAGDTCIIEAQHVLYFPQFIGNIPQIKYCFRKLRLFINIILILKYLIVLCYLTTRQPIFTAKYPFKFIPEFLRVLTDEVFGVGFLFMLIK